MSMKIHAKTTMTRLPGIVAAVLLVLASQAVWAEGDPAKGEKVYKKCKTCHSLEAGKNKVGPHLNGVIGRQAGAVEGFKYSSAMADSGLVWDEETLDLFLAKPKEVVPKTKMAFPGLKKEADRQDVIVYMKEAGQ
jgi:cytochrome c